MIPALNLLDPKRKLEVKRTKTLLLLHEILLFIFIITVAGSAALLSARIILEQKFREAVLEQVPGTVKLAKLNRDIQTINQRLSRINLLTSGYMFWPPAFLELLKLTPDEIQWNALNISENGEFVLTGTSHTRNGLVRFKDQLSASQHISGLDLPLRYLVEKQNNIFTLEAVLDIKQLNASL